MNRLKLKGVPETLLISLNARCNETIHPKGLISDPKSLEIAKMVGSDFRNERSVHLTNVGTAMRTIVFDRYTQDFLKRYPNGTIVNIACGLDTRFYRLDNGCVDWYDVDFPVVIDTRKKLFEENPRHHYIDKSVLNFSWLDNIPKDKPVFLSAEGLFCYFTQQEVEQVLTQVAKVFSKAEFVIEAISPFMVKNTKQHPSMKGFDAQFRWGIDSGKMLDDWDTGFHFVDEEFFMEMKECKQRSLMVRLFCLSKQFAKSMKIFRLRNYVEY